MQQPDNSPALRLAYRGKKRRKRRGGGVIFGEVAAAGTGVVWVEPPDPSSQGQTS